jgi:hypothetical protein
MAAQIHCHETVFPRQVRRQLSLPGEATLRKTMDEQDGPTSRIACFHEMNANASAPMML